MTCVRENAVLLGMRADTKWTIALVFTLLVGVCAGMYLDATFVRDRRETRRERDRQANRPPRPPGLVERFERVIEPRNAAQADSIRAVLQPAIDGNDRIIADANERLRARNDTLRRRLAPLLDAEQLTRLDRELDRIPGVGGRGGPPPDGRVGPRPDGRGRRGGPPPPF